MSGPTSAKRRILECEGGAARVKDGDAVQLGIGGGEDGGRIASEALQQRRDRAEEKGRFARRRGDRGAPLRQCRSRSLCHRERSAIIEAVVGVEQRVLAG